MAYMELKFMTPTEVWEGFDAKKAPLEASIISAQTKDNIVCSQQIFTADSVKEERIRACCKLFYDSRWQDARPAILVLPSFDSPVSVEYLRYLIEDGFVICALDYCGIFEENGTTFPDEWNFALLPECKNHLDDIQNGARNTPWFVWTKIARRAITLLQENSIVDKSHIALMGFGEGAQLSWQVAGTDDRVRALVAINGGGYRWTEGTPKFLSTDIPEGDEQLAYSTGVGAETYARFVSCPTLAVVASDSMLCDMDRIGDMLDLVKSQNKRLIISASCNGQLSKSVGIASLKWVHDALASDDKEQTPPTIHFECADGRLYVRANTIRKAKERKLYISYGEPYPQKRCWVPVDIEQKVGEHEYVCDVPVYDAEELIVAYATFVYDDGEVISTKTACTLPSKHNVTAIESTRLNSRIIYDGSMGIGSFVARTKEAIIDDGILHVAEGPYGIIGITLERGDLSLSRSVREMFSLSRSASLHLDAYSNDARELEISVLSSPDLKKYSARVRLLGGEFWQKLMFDASDFKSEEGKTLSSFNAAKAIEINNVDGVILNNFLWI